MNYELGVKIFNDIINGNNHTIVNRNTLNNYTDHLIDMMKKGVISLDEQNLLDNYINYLRDNAIDDYENILVGYYDNSLMESSNKRLKEEMEAKAIGEVKVKKITDHSGTIKIVSLLEIVILLGIFISVLCIVFK